ITRPDKPIIPWRAHGHMWLAPINNLYRISRCRQFIFGGDTDEIILVNKRLFFAVYQYLAYIQRIEQIKKQHMCGLRRYQIDGGITVDGFLLKIYIQRNSVMANIHIGLLGFELSAGGEVLLGCYCKSPNSN